MKKILISAAFAVAALASCQKNEVVAEKQDEIRFNVMTENQTKAVDVYSSTNLMDEFYVSAVYTPREGSRSWYFKGVKVTKKNGIWTPEKTLYWPEEGHLLFYATTATPDQIVYDNQTYEMSIQNFEYIPSSREQKDILYATQGHDNLGYEYSNLFLTTVNLHFRHALSQIDFRAKCTAENVKVVIETIYVEGGVSLDPSNGLSFDLPSEPTGNCLSNTMNEYQSTGEWTNVTEDTNDELSYRVLPIYEYDEYDEIVEGFVPDPIAVIIGGEDAKAITDDATSMLLIPTSGLPDGGTTPFDPSDPNNDPEGGMYFGSRITVFGTIYGTDENGQDIQLNGLSHMIPVSFKWEAGKRYVYTLIFSESDPSDPDPLISPIGYDVTIENFVDGEISSPEDGIININ